MSEADEGNPQAEAPARRSLRERLERLSRMALLVFILASAAFLSAVTAMRIAIHGREVTMPALVGKNVSEASRLLASQGLVLRVADRAYSDLPINVVVRQTPPPGMLMKVSQQAHVVLSLGQRKLTIPAIEGKSLRVSRIELLRTGLQIGEVSVFTTPEVAPDTVVLQSPRPGSSAATPRVDVLVAEPRPEGALVMPYLIGLTETQALGRLDPASVRHKENYVTAPQWPYGTVVDQTPRGGSRLAAATTVELTVAH
ncbi:MAG TPA: PASTA domain-containing protein [Methylomirabilota bacterium]|jgi:serine/threonine-protein kinase|nr:PASTA domain-containing protein [Methylomirabilota bacterium]